MKTFFITSGSGSDYNSKGEWVHCDVFTTFSSKGNNFCDFLFAFLDIIHVAFPNKCLFLKQRICSCRSQFFALRTDSTEKGGKAENGRVDSPKSAPIPFKIFQFLLHKSVSFGPQ